MEYLWSMYGVSMEHVWSIFEGRTDLKFFLSSPKKTAFFFILPKKCLVSPSLLPPMILRSSSVDPIVPEREEKRF
jgi:hypothetical protein